MQGRRIHPLKRIAAMLLMLWVLTTASGCASVAQGLISIPIDVSRHVAMESAKVPFDAAGIAANGVADAMFKK